MVFDGIIGSTHTITKAHEIVSFRIFYIFARCRTIHVFSTYLPGSNFAISAHRLPTVR